MAPTGIVTALFAGAVRATGSPREEYGVVEEVAFGGGPQTSSSIYWSCRRRTSTEIATSSLAWTAGTALQVSLKSIIIVRTAGTTVLGSTDIIILGDWPAMFAHGVAETSPYGPL